MKLMSITNINSATYTSQPDLEECETNKLKREGRYKIIGLGVSIIMIVFYYLFVFKYAINIPFADDYDQQLAFIDSWINIDSTTEKIKLLFSQHNEHRLFTTRIIPLLSYELFGFIDMRHTMYVGNVAILGIWLTLLHLIHKDKHKLYDIIPATHFNVYPIIHVCVMGSRLAPILFLSLVCDVGNVFFR